jgi:hypothetical protein
MKDIKEIRRLINLVESAQLEQLDEGIKEKILSLGLAASIFSGSVTANDIKQDMEIMSSIAVTPYLMEPQKINKVQQTPEFQVFAKSLHMLGPRETQMLEKYHQSVKMMFILKSTQARVNSTNMKKVDKEIELGVPGSNLDSYKTTNTTYKETNPQSVLQSIRDYITGKYMGPEYSQAMNSEYFDTPNAEEQELINDMKQRQKIYDLAKKDKIYVAALVEMYIYLKKTAPSHIIFSRTAQDVQNDEKRFQEFIKSGEGF